MDVPAGTRFFSINLRVSFLIVSTSQLSGMLRHNLHEATESQRDDHMVALRYLVITLKSQRNGHKWVPAFCIDSTTLKKRGALL